mmetsp:Transcript_48020/g.88409  ORF Transcript_48020/g.88409 Transcript_48020/m.88409 type:complete len:395 (-) Transcript_48020:1047-2231(-)
MPHAKIFRARRGDSACLIKAARNLPSIDLSQFIDLNLLGSEEELGTWSSVRMESPWASCSVVASTDARKRSTTSAKALCLSCRWHLSSLRLRSRPATISLKRLMVKSRKLVMHVHSFSTSSLKDLRSTSMALAAAFPASWRRKRSPSSSVRSSFSCAAQVPTGSGHPSMMLSSSFCISAIASLAKAAMSLPPFFRPSMVSAKRRLRLRWSSTIWVSLCSSRPAYVLRNCDSLSPASSTAACSSSTICVASLHAACARPHSSATRASSFFRLRFRGVPGVLGAMFSLPRPCCLLVGVCHRRVESPCNRPRSKASVIPERREASRERVSSTRASARPSGWSEFPSARWLVSHAVRRSNSSRASCSCSWRSTSGPSAANFLAISSVSGSKCMCLQSS